MAVEIKYNCAVTGTYKVARYKSSFKRFNRYADKPYYSQKVEVEFSNYCERLIKGDGTAADRLEKSFEYRIKGIDCQLPFGILYAYLMSDNTEGELGEDIVKFKETLIRELTPLS